MSGSHPKSRYIWAAAGLMLLGAFLALRSNLRVRQAFTVVRLKATGSLPDVGWMDLFRMARPGFGVAALATMPNPYASIRNPYSFAADVAAGRDIYQSHCSTCHGADGSGGPGGPALLHQQLKHGSSDWAVFSVVSAGIRGTSMPGSDLPWLDKWRLVAYVKSLMLQAERPLDSTPDSGIRSLEPVRYEDIRGAGQIQDRWLTYAGSYDSHRFSSLAQITTANAAGLRLLWTRQYSTSEESIKTSPLVVGHYMFVTVPPNRVEALDARTGALIWAYDRQLPTHLSLCCGYANRGLAVLGSTLFFGTLDAHLVALNIGTGEVRWDVEIADYRTGYSITNAPLVLKDLVVTGIAGGEFGIRGFVEARDAETGKKVWRFNTVPEPGQPGADTWEGDSWKTGGASTWVSGSFDPETNLIYWPVGNPSPNFEGEARKGDNLYSNSIVALDADHGTLRWYFQFTPHDNHDWDATETPVLLDVDIAGKRQRYLAQANRNAFYYLLDRETGKFLLARPFAKETWAERIDSNGRPVAIPGTDPTEHGTVVYPSVGGATNWQSPTYSPRTGLLYVSAIDWGGIYNKVHSAYHPGDLFLGGASQFFNNVRAESAVRALNAVTGELQWEHRNIGGQTGGLLSTEGGVVFGGQEQNFFALDARSGDELWRVGTGGTIWAAPITFLCDGQQMVTIAAGHDLLTFGLPSPNKSTRLKQ